MPGNDIGSCSGQITYAFYDAGSPLGPVISTGTATGLSATPTGNNPSVDCPTVACPVQEVDFNLLIPLPVGIASYYLELHHGNSLTATVGDFEWIYWALAAGNGSHLYGFSTGLVAGVAVRNRRPARGERLHRRRRIGGVPMAIGTPPPRMTGRR
jgi:hypothetical protein